METVEAESGVFMVDVVFVKVALKARRIFEARPIRQQHYGVIVRMDYVMD